MDKRIKILHIGNIANNGYMAAKVLNQVGIESHCLVADYYHIMGCPEWEEADVKGDIGDQFFPQWHKVDLGGYQRPRWFAQGPRFEAVDYLIAYNEGNETLSEELWEKLNFHNKLISDVKTKKHIERVNSYREKLSFIKKVYNKLMSYVSKVGDKINHVFWRLKQEKWKIHLIFMRKIMNFPLVTILAAITDRLFKTSFTSKITSFLMHQQAFIDSYLEKEEFNSDSELELEDKYNFLKRTPSTVLKRHFQTLQDPIEGYRDVALQYDCIGESHTKLFNYYDIIIGYSTDGIWPLICGKPYISFEHGTIRKLPYERSFQGQMCQIVYKNAKATLITNYDNNISAEKMELKNYYPIPHPTMEFISDVEKEEALTLRQKIFDNYNIDFIVFHPSRHIWSDNGVKNADWDKGNEVIIKGFAEHIKKTGKSLLILVEFGPMVDKSKKLIEDLHIDSFVLWIKPQNHRNFIKFIMASDIIADQFQAPLTFGGIPPKAMICSKPVLTYYSFDMMSWVFDKPPPFINSNKPKVIAEKLTYLYENRDECYKLGQEGNQWYHENYSINVFIKQIKKVVKETYNIDLN